MRKKTSFSVITPSLNQGRYIETAIRSVLEQGYPDIEHVVLDGGSSDDTVERLKKYPHLRWTSAPDRGKTEALNRGFREASGDIIAWLNADDYYHPGCFRAVAEYFDKNPDAKAVAGRAVVVDPDGRPLFPHPEPDARAYTHEGMKEYWRHGLLPQPSVFFRREVFEKTGYLDEDIWSYMDYDFFLRLSRDFPVGRIEAVLSSIRFHPEADTVLNIACGLLEKSLHRISRNYWGPAGSREYVRHSLSYALYWPRIRWNIHYESFAFEARDEMKRLQKECGPVEFVRRTMRYFWKYPAAYLYTALKKGYRQGAAA